MTFFRRWLLILGIVIGPLAGCDQRKHAAPVKADSAKTDLIRKAVPIEVARPTDSGSTGSTSKNSSGLDAEKAVKPEGDQPPASSESRKDDSSE
jgi:hypothetical protein